MKRIISKLLIFGIVIFVSSCSSADFECPAPKGQGCKKIMQIDQY
jgi:hypothetical protein